MIAVICVRPRCITPRPPPSAGSPGPPPRSAGVGGWSASLFAWCLTSSPPRSSRDFDVLRPPLLERAARIVAGLQICAVDDRRRVVPMGASRARHVNGSRRRQGSTCFRFNDGSGSVRAVFGLPPRSDRGSRRADAVAIPTALSSRQDLTVIAPFRFKGYLRMRKERCSSSKSCRPRALRPGLLHGLPAEPSSPGRSHRVPEATRSLASARLLRQHHDERVLYVRRVLAGGTNRQEPGDTAAYWAPALLRKHGNPIPRPTQNGSQVRGEAGR